MPNCTIIGAGPVGTLLALLQAARGHQVHLFERRADPRGNTLERGRSINLALAARGIVALEQAGLMPRVRGHMVTMPGRMLHAIDGTLEFLNYGRSAQEVIYAISRERLNRLLIDAAAEHPNIELQFHQRCLDVDPSTSQVRLRDELSGLERTQSFELLFGADGAGSAVRQSLMRHRELRASEEPLAHDYKELQIPAGLADQAPRYVFEPHALHIWPRGGFMLIALPNDDHSFTATLFLARNGTPGFDQLRDEHAVSDFFRREFGDAAAAIPDLPQQFGAHPQGHLGTLRCESWNCDGRILLLGDAAHAIVPFHGQGLNCGFEDCRLLDKLLTQMPPERALPEFERQRRPDTDAIADMALENYLEMRDGVRSPHFARRKRLAGQLEAWFPDRFIPRYSMVMFHPEIGYAEAQRRGLLQEQVLDALGESPSQSQALRLLDSFDL